jgi:nicotinamidase-related amidase
MTRDRTHGPGTRAMESFASMRRDCALLILDMVNPFSYPDGPASLRAAKTIAKTVHAIAPRFRRRGAPCIYVNDNFGQWQSDFRALLETVSRTRGAQVLEWVRPAEGDLFVLKPKHSAFYQTPLPSLLESMGVGSLLVCGIETDSCVMATAMDAHMREYEVRVPSNASASASAARQRAALLLMRHNRIETRAWRPGQDRPGR